MNQQQNTVDATAELRTSGKELTLQDLESVAGGSIGGDLIWREVKSESIIPPGSRSASRGFTS